MSWVIDENIIGNESCTQFKNTSQDELNPQTAYMTSPFIITTDVKTDQTITFNSSDTLIITNTNNKKNLTAVASSNLLITYKSYNNNIATIYNNSFINAIITGIVNIEASQNGDINYNPADTVICTFTITYNFVKTGLVGILEYPIVITLYIDKPNIKTINVNIDEVEYTQFSGISYTWRSGFHGASMIGSITCLDSNNIPVTDFTDYPINITISMANANTLHSYKIWKRNGIYLLNPQPDGYPVTLTYQSGFDWTGTMTNLSDIVILDDTPPVGDGGGDPYIVSVKKIKTLLPNEWRRVKLLETDSILIIANCNLLNKEVISNLHYINNKKQVCLSYDPNMYKWARTTTYILSIEFIDKQTDEKLILDTINSEILSNNSKIIYEKIMNNDKGLYSITHNYYYPLIEFNEYILYFNEGRLVISIDKYWDDINHIQLFLNDSNYEKYSGELIEHNKLNNIVTKKINTNK